MMKKTKLALLTSAAIALSANAYAGNANKFYGSFHGEFIAFSDSDLEIASTTTNATGDADYDLGFGIGGAAGYYINDDIRVEAEVSYRETDLDNATIGGVTFNNGELELWSVMANTYYNYKVNEKFSPYLGAGIGAAYNDSDNETAFAYQGMAGVDYKLDDNGTLYGGYRYFGTTEFEDSYNVSGVGRVTSSLDVSQHIIEFGYRYTF
jgi:opacity protein-like surface antigen